MTDTHIVDANVILRYLLADHPELHARAKRFFGEVLTLASDQAKSKT